jgi:hypothetical protein
MKPPFLGIEQDLIVGKEEVFGSDTPDGSRGVVFEDDGETGYFYARDYTLNGDVVDALHIYNVKGVIDRDKPSKLKIIWTRDFSAAALLINQIPQAVFNFAERCGYAESPWPDPTPKSKWVHSSKLSETKELFFPSK